MCRLHQSAVHSAHADYVKSMSRSSTSRRFVVRLDRMLDAQTSDTYVYNVHSALPSCCHAQACGLTVSDTYTQVALSLRNYQRRQHGCTIQLHLQVSRMNALIVIGHRTT